MFRIHSMIGVVLALTLLMAADKTTVRDAAWIDQRVKDWQPTDEEKRFDEIGWAKDIHDALRLAKEHGRPVFLLSYNGRMATGRC